MAVFQSAIFDLDGTLIDSLPDIHYALNVALKKLDLPEIDAEAAREGVGYGINNLIYRGIKASLAIAGCVDEAAVDRFVEAQFLEMREAYRSAYREAATRTAAYPGVLEGLTRLKERRITLAVVTNKAEEFSRGILKRQGLIDFFSAVVGEDTYDFKKPNMMIWTRLSNECAMERTSTLMVGDGRADVEFAERIGCPLCLCRYGITSRNEMDKWARAYTADSFSDVVACILGEARA